MWLILWFAGTIWSCFIIDSDHEIPSRAAEPLPGALPMLQISRESEIENLNTVIARFSYILGSSSVVEVHWNWTGKNAILPDWTNLPSRGCPKSINPICSIWKVVQCQCPDRCIHFRNQTGKTNSQLQRKFKLFKIKISIIMVITSKNHISQSSIFSCFMANSCKSNPYQNTKK